MRQVDAAACSQTNSAFGERMENVIFSLGKLAEKGTFDEGRWDWEIIY